MRSLCVLICVASAHALPLTNTTVAYGQDAYFDDLPLYKREPFDRITLDKANDSAIVDVYPIQSLDRTAPPTEITGTLKIRRIQDPPDQLYNVNGASIAKLTTFNYLLLNEATRLLAANKVDDAFHYIARLKNEFPKTRGLGKITETFYYKDAGFLFSRKRYDEALLSLDQVFRSNPDRDGLPRVLDRVLSQIIQTEYAAGNYSSVRAKLSFARRKYGSLTRATVTSWEQKLKERAAAEIDVGRAAFQSGDSTKALAAIRNANESWPNASGAEELSRQIMAKYPRVRVAVTQPFATPERLDPTQRQLNWAARRVTPLLARGVVTFREFTSDGGVYESRIGTLKTSPDRKQIDLTLRAEDADRVYDLARSMLQLGNPSSEEFSERWAEYLKTVYVPASKQLQVTFTRPSLLPVALLPRAVVGNGLQGEFEQVRSPSTQFQTFQARRPNRDVREISETYFDSPSEATNALLAGDVDVIDRVYPPDIANLKTQSSIRVAPYRLPTVHGIVFNDREPLLRNATFRRGILYGINRQEFVRTELNAGARPPIAKVISGFAPIGIDNNDPLGYAYDQDVEPRKYDPSLAVVLLRLAMAQRRNLQGPPQSSEPKQPAINAAEPSAGEESPEESPEQSLEAKPPEEEPPTLVLAFPDSPVAIAASESIASDLKRIGISVTLHPMKQGRGWPEDRDWDLLYIETTIEEPLADIPELILGHTILGRHGGLVWQAARTLQESSTIEDARNQFHRMHHLTYSHTPLLPLWQVIEHSAVRDVVRGTATSQISLYDNVSEWRLGQ